MPSSEWPRRLDKLLQPFHRLGQTWTKDVEAFRNSDPKIRAQAVRNMAQAVPIEMNRHAFHLLGNMLLEEPDPDVRHEVSRQLPDLVWRHKKKYDETANLYLSALARETRSQVRDALVNHLIAAANLEGIEDLDLMDRVLERIGREAGQADDKHANVANIGNGRRAFKTLTRLAQNGKLWIRPQAMKQIRAMAERTESHPEQAGRAVAFLLDTAKSQMRRYGKVDPAIMRTLGRSGKKIKGPMAIHDPLNVFLKRYARRGGPTLWTDAWATHWRT